MAEIKLVMTGVIGVNTQASITIFNDETWRVELQGENARGELATIALYPEMIAELQGLLRRAGVGRKKKEKTDV